MGRRDESRLVIAAPAASVYRVLVDPADVVRWLPPAGMIGEIDSWDCRPGGAYRMTLRYSTAGHGKSTAGSDVVFGEFVELVPDERMVQTAIFDSDDPIFAGTMVMSWLLRPAGDDATEVTIRADDVPAGISPEDHAAGLASSLANLADFLRTQT